MPAPNNPPAVIRRARPNEAAALSDLALRSKAHWGYDDAFMDACRAELSVSPEDIERHIVVVALVGCEIAGFYSLEPDSDGGGEVDALFVQPDFIGRGIGRRLFADLCRRAEVAGCHAIFLESDPFARGFYERMGCAIIGEAPSGSIPGRLLPRMHRRLGMDAAAEV